MESIVGSYSEESFTGLINRLVGVVSVHEDKDIVSVNGINVTSMFADISRHFKTSKVVNNIFIKTTHSSVKLHSFFLIDFEYIVRTLADQPKTRLGKRMYIKIREELKLNTWIGKLEKDLPSIFNREKIKEIKYSLLEHQDKFIEYYDKIIPRYGLKGLLLAADPGLGKTITSIAVACAYESENVIVISPKNAVFRVWESTLLNDMAVKQTCWVAASGTPMPSPNQNRWFVFHYEALDKAIELAKLIKDRKCTVILDESHNLNDIKSLRTERFIGLCNMMAKSIIVELSGTPMKALGYEAIPLIKAIDPKFNDACLDAFKKMFGKDALRATDILSNRLGIVMYRVKREDDLVKPLEEHWLNVKVDDEKRFLLSSIKDDMVKFIDSRFQFYSLNMRKYEDIYNFAIKEYEVKKLKNVLTPEHQTYLRYVEILKEKAFTREDFGMYSQYCNKYEKVNIEPFLRPEQRAAFRDAKSVVKYVDLKIRGEALGTVLSRARAECNKAIVQSFDFTELIDNSEKKTLIFTSYVEVVKATESKLIGQGYKPIVVYADTNANLNSLIKVYGEDENINPLIATYQSLSTAVPLTMANTVILLNQPFRIYEKEQAVARANRIGQDKQVRIYNILLDTGNEPNISTRSLDILKWSEEQVNAIMGFTNNIDVGIENLVCDIECNARLEANNYYSDDILTQYQNATGHIFNEALITHFKEVNTETTFDTGLPEYGVIPEMLSLSDSFNLFNELKYNFEKGSGSFFSPGWLPLAEWWVDDNRYILYVNIVENNKLCIINYDSSSDYVVLDKTL